jgi:hypothetical protein
LLCVIWFCNGDAECEEVKNGSLPCFVGKLIDITQIPKYVREYERGSDVEIWQIRYEKRFQFRDSCDHVTYTKICEGV